MRHWTIRHYIVHMYQWIPDPAENVQWSGYFDVLPLCDRFKKINPTTISKRFSEVFRTALKRNV